MGASKRQPTLVYNTGESLGRYSHIPLISKRFPYKVGAASYPPTCIFPIPRCRPPTPPRLRRRQILAYIPLAQPQCRPPSAFASPLSTGASRILRRSWIGTEATPRALIETAPQRWSTRTRHYLSSTKRTAIAMASGVGPRILTRLDHRRPQNPPPPSLHRLLNVRRQPPWRSGKIIPERVPSGANLPQS